VIEGPNEEQGALGERQRQKSVYMKGSGGVAKISQGEESLKKVVRRSETECRITAGREETWGQPKEARTIKSLEVIN